MSATAVSSRQINLAWTASTDNVAVVGYNIYQGSSKIGTATTTGYSSTGLIPSTSYTFTVTAYDAASNESAPSASVSATTPANSASARADIGMNAGAYLYWQQATGDGFQFANQILHSTFDTGSVNALGYPTGTTAGIYLWTDTSDMNGTYRFSCNGNVSLSCSDGTISNVQYVNGVTTATLVTTDAGSTSAHLSFSGMTANPSGSITNVKLMQPIAPGSSTSYDPSVTFASPYIQLMQKFSVIRTMDMTATNGNIQKDWSDRVTKNQFSQVNNLDTYGWEGRGVAWEYVIELANTAQRDVWICVPYYATDDYVTQLAQLFKANLNPDLKLYVEFANEVWNTSGGFAGNWNHDDAVAEVAAGSSLNFDGDTNDWFWAWRRIGKRGAEISQIFRTVFTDSQMMTQVRPVLESQMGYTEGPLAQAMHYVQGYMATLAPTPHPVSYYFWGGGGSSYYGQNGSTIAAVLANCPEPTWAQDQQTETDFVTPFGLKRVAYEGGPGFDDLSAAEVGAWHDPGMTARIVAAHDIFTQAGGDLSVYFCADGDERWRWAGLTHADYLSSYKLQGIDQLNAQAMAPCTFGTAIPANISAGSYSTPPTWFSNENPSDATLNAYWGYTVFSNTAKSYSISVKAGATNANGKLKLTMDGNEIGTLTIPNTGSTSSYAASNAFTISLDAGKHGILIQCTAGAGFSVNQIVIQ